MRETSQFVVVYVLGFALVVGLGAASAAALTAGGAVGIAAAIAIAWVALSLAKALLPRQPRFVPHGLRVDAARCPALFAAIGELARQTAQPPPREVYLLNEVNGFVLHRGGVAGFGGTPVMGLGLPLLHALTVAEARSVIAHEFGHFVGGDTRLAPWLYALHERLAQLVTSRRGLRAWLHAPALVYARLLLRCTREVSRRQELRADAVAARVAGVEAARTTLRKVPAAALAFRRFWEDECVPLLEQGFRPPLGEGFARFVVEPEIATRVEAALRSSAAGSPDPFETHPSLDERLAALEGADDAPPADDDGESAAARWLEDLDGLERELLAAVGGEAAAAALRPIGWDDVGEVVYAPTWRAHAHAIAPQVAKLKIGEIKGGAALRALGAALAAAPAPGTPQARPSEAELVDVAVQSLGACVATSLMDAGWSVHTPIAGEAHLASGDRRFEPWGELGRLAGGELSDQGWRALLAKLGIAALPLAPRAAASSSKRSARSAIERSARSAAERRGRRG